MKINRRIAALIALGAATTACAPAKPAPADSAHLTAARTTAVRDSVKVLLAEFLEKMNKGDMDGVGKLYSDDSSFFWIEGAAVRFQSAKDVRAGLMTLKGIPEISMKFYETHIDVLAPTIANVRTEFSQTFLDGKGKGDTYGGYMTITVLREADGWKFRNGHASSRRPRI
ncbi:MAG: nuclear transport factor 2 family protein [Gemmatimonas sp.]